MQHSLVFILFSFATVGATIGRLERTRYDAVQMLSLAVAVRNNTLAGSILPPGLFRWSVLLSALLPHRRALLLLRSRK